jgi:putative endonuclease
VLGFLYRISDSIRRLYWRGDHGRIGEDLAHTYLRGRGCKVVARNYRTRSAAGEADLVAWHGDSLVFVEVKTRQTADYGAPDRAVDEEKRERIRIAARDYARRANVPFDRARFDIVSVVLSPKLEIDWMQDAYAPFKDFVRQPFRPAAGLSPGVPGRSR